MHLGAEANMLCERENKKILMPTHVDGALKVSSGASRKLVVAGIQNKSTFE